MTAVARRFANHPAHARLEEFAEERRRFIRDTDDLIRCLTIEFEIELGPGLAVIPVGEMFELAPPQRPLGERCAFDGDAHTRRLPADAALLRDRFGGGDNAARDEALPALILAPNTKTVSPSAIRLPPYIVFCAANANVLARGSQTSALIANAMLLLSASNEYHCPRPPAVPLAVCPPETR